MAGVSATAALVSVHTSIASTSTGPGASLVNAERLDVPTTDYGDWSGAEDDEVIQDDLEYFVATEVDDTPVDPDYWPRH